jgi:hypothetical protein
MFKERNRQQPKAIYCPQSELEKKGSLARSVGKCAALICASLLALSEPSTASAQNVLTERYDNARTGANLSETQLNPSTVASGAFGRIGNYTVDGSVYAQPLYVQNVAIPGVGTRNMLYVVTMENVVYAFNADSVGSAPLWALLTLPAPVPISDITPPRNIVGNIGIESTPVIDLSTNTMYFVARSKEPSSNCGGPNPTYCQRLHAVDITTGAEKFGGPVVIAATQGALTFDTRNQNQRASLALANGQVYIAWGSHEDKHVWYGWFMSYNATTLQQTGIYAPPLSNNGIWMSGRAPAIDSSGNLYVMTGNGFWDGVSSFSESMLKFGPGGGLPLVDWFTPDNHAAVDAADEDYGASGPMLVPGTNLVIGGGKHGVFYMMNTASLGHIQSGNGQIVQSLNNNGGFIKSGPVYWNRSGGAGPWMYNWSDGNGGNEVIKAYHFNGSTFDASLASWGTVPSPGGNSGGVLTLSANGGTPGTGIVWASMPLNADGENGVIQGVLRAFNADNLAQQLWSSTGRSGDDMGNWPKFSPPTVANGRVYIGSVPTAGIFAPLNVYGLAPPAPTSVTASQAGCNGLYLVSWPAVSGATSYAVWVKTPFDATYTQTITTTGTTATIRAINSTTSTFVEVQACNGSNCGLLSGPHGLRYYNGCP